MSVLNTNTEVNEFQSLRVYTGPDVCTPTSHSDQQQEVQLSLSQENPGKFVMIGTVMYMYTAITFRN